MSPKDQKQEFASSVAGAAAFLGLIGYLAAGPLPGIIAALGVIVLMIGLRAWAQRTHHQHSSAPRAH